MELLNMFGPRLRFVFLVFTVIAANGCAVKRSSRPQAPPEVLSSEVDEQSSEPADLATVRRLLDEARAGDAAAQYLLAQQLLRNVPGESGRRSALKWVQRASLGGYQAASRWTLIYHLQYGSAQEQAAAHQQLLTTSTIDEAERQLLLGTDWWLGRGTAVDHSRALAAWQRAGSLGSVEALYNLVLLPLHHPEITLDQRAVYDQLSDIVRERTLQLPAEVHSALPYLTDWLGSKEQL